VSNLVLLDRDAAAEVDSAIRGRATTVSVLRIG
jgi:hypothetical protein